MCLSLITKYYSSFVLITKLNDQIMRLLKIFCLLALLLVIKNSKTFAQQNHFVYIQASDEQPFYVVLNGKIYSSTETGYLIIPQLISGDYPVRLGFPLNKYPEQNFSIPVQNIDAGYELKKENENNWYLANLHSTGIIPANGAKIASTKNSGFGEMLSEVVDDSELTQNRAVVSESIIPPPATEPVVEENDAPAMDVTVKNKIEEADAEAENTIPGEIIGAQPIDANSPLKLSEQKDSDGTGLVFLDVTSANNDTIRIYIPSEAFTAVDPEKIDRSELTDQTPVFDENKTSQPGNDEVITIGNSPDNTEITDNAGKDLSNPFFKNEKKNRVVKEDVQQQNIPVSSEVAQTKTNPDLSHLVRADCTNMVSDDDMDKLKRKMFSQRTDEKMIDAARKMLLGKCIETDQVRVLSVLFLSDEGRYNLFDAMYNYVYDFGKYASLDNQILDPYYKKRFAALIRN